MDWAYKCYKGASTLTPLPNMVHDLNSCALVTVTQLHQV